MSLSSWTDRCLKETSRACDSIQPRLAERSKGGTQLSCENLWLLPRCEVAALFGSAVINEFGVSPFRPAPRSLILLSWKDGYGHRDRDAFGVEEAAFVFPIETRSG